MDRDKFYSNSEACKLFKLSPAKFESIIASHNIPVVTKDIHTADYSNNPYTVTAKYVDKELFVAALKH